MIKESLLKILCCPETRQAVEEAPRELIDQLNQRIQAGEVKNQEGQVVAEPLESGLIREDRKILYPIREGIPIMLVTEGIVLENPAAAES